MYRQFLLVCLLGLCIFPAIAADLQLSNASEQTQCNFQDHTDLTIEYGSMRMDGRKIFGVLVPYGKAWNMGSARPPTFVTSTNLLVGGKEVPVGHYSLYTIPNPDKWILVISKIPSKEHQNETAEVARVDLLVRHLAVPVEKFTMSFDTLRFGCQLNLRWEETETSVLLAEKK